MMNLTQKLKLIRDSLQNIDAEVYHYDGCGSVKDYIVWAEDGESTSLEADNRKREQTITGTIDFFTKTEYNPVVDDIQNALNERNISFVLNSVQFEVETGLIHYEWRFEI